MNRKILISITLLFFLSFIGLVVYFLIPRSYLTFQTAPNQVVVLIDSKDRVVVSNGSSVTIGPGKHSLTIFRNDFNPHTEIVDIKNGETKDISVALLPLTSAAKKLMDNVDSQKVIEKTTGIDMSRQIELTKKLNPITNILPISNRNYHISYCPSENYPDSPNKIALCIDIPSEDFKIYVNEDLKSRGFNPDDFEIIWNIYLSEEDITP